LAAERGVISQALDTLNHDPAFAGRVELVTYAYENIVPARSGMAAQEIVNAYMLRPEDADLFICLLWRRMGSVQQGLINPATNAPYQSGAEYEYLSAYAAAQRQPTPLILLYHCQRPVPAPTTEEEQIQLDRVRQFFSRFDSNAGGDLRGLVGRFTTEADLAATIQRDVGALLRRDLLPLLELRHRPRTDQPVAFALPALPAGVTARPESQGQVRKVVLGSRPQVGIVSATALHGLGGLGKTVLARLAWDDPAIRAAFPDGVLWATLGQQPDLASIQRDWVIALHGDIFKVSGLDLEAGRAELQRLLGDRAVLLVLDNLWRAQDAEALSVSGPGLKTLITTRDIGQAPEATAVELDLMSLAECRQTVQQALGARSLDEATLDAIADRMGRLPLALRVIGGALRRSDLIWPQMAAQLDAGQLAGVAGRDTRLFEAMRVSVQALPAEQQARYRELVVFPEGTPLHPFVVGRLWAHTGRMSEYAATELLSELRERSLLQADHRLHDLQGDYLRAVVPPEAMRALHSAVCDAYATPPEPMELVGPTADDTATADASPWSRLPEDDELYGWRYVATHLDHAGRTTDLDGLLTDVTYLEGKITRLGVAATVSDLTLRSAVDPVRQLATVIRAGVLILEEYPDELPNQVRGRAGDIPALHHLPERPRPYFALTTRSLMPSDPALVRQFTGHTSDVTSCAFSPDGRYALSASSDDTLRLWEVATGQELRRFTGHTDWVHGCAFSPDGRYALSASADHTLRLWEVATGAQRAVWHGEATNTCCAFSPLWDQALTGDAVSGVHLFRIAGLGRDEAGAAQEPELPAPVSHEGKPGPVASSISAALPAPPVEATPRRKRFWFS
jgi:hypothetical protein